MKVKNNILPLILLGTTKLERISNTVPVRWLWTYIQPEDGHTGLKHAVQQNKTTEGQVCEKVTANNNHQEST